MAVAKPRVVVHQMSFRGPPAVMELPFAETLAAPKLGAILHMDHVQSGVVIANRVRYLTEWPAKPGKSSYFR
jgi:hypothetical protein